MSCEDEELPPREYVESLMDKASYRTSNRTTLEAYVDAQASGQGSYYYEANKALLKIYQFLPDTVNVTTVATILLLSMMERKANSARAVDTLSLMYLIPDRFQKMEPCASVIECNRSLDSCEFVEFWNSYESLSSLLLNGSEELQSPHYLKELLGSSRAETELRNGILDVMALTYRSAKLSTVLSNLNLSSMSDLSSLSSSAVESINDTTVTFVKTSNNSKRGRVYQEGISYGDIASMMSKVNVSAE